MEYSSQDLIGIALSGYDLYAPGESSRMNIDKRSEQIAFKSWYWESLENIQVSYYFIKTSRILRTSLTLRDRTSETNL